MFSFALGHSHQLFHVCGIIGTYFQMEVLILDMNLRRTWLLDNGPHPTISQTIGAWGLAIIISSLIIASFSWTLYWKPKKRKL